MSAMVVCSSPSRLCAFILTTLLFASSIPCMGSESGKPQPPQVVPESTVGYAVDGPRPVVSVKPGEQLILGSAPKNISIDLKDKTVVVKDANLNVVSFDTIALRDRVTVWRKDKKVFILIGPKPTMDPSTN